MRLLNNKWATLAGALAMTLALAACGGSSPSEGPPERPAPKMVDMTGVTMGYTVPSGTYNIPAGVTETVGDAAFTCASGGAACTVMVADDGTATYARDGGTVTAMNSASYQAQLDADREAAETVALGMARTDAAMAAKTAEASASEAQDALDLVMEDAAADQASYDMAEAALEAAKTAARAAREASEAADRATTSADAMKQKDIAQTERDKAAGALEDVQTYTGMVAQAKMDADRKSAEATKLTDAQSAAQMAHDAAKKASDNAAAKVEEIKASKDLNTTTAAAFARAADAAADAAEALLDAIAANTLAQAAMTSEEAEEHKAAVEEAKRAAEAAYMATMRFANVVSDEQRMATEKTDETRKLSEAQDAAGEAATMARTAATDADTAATEAENLLGRTHPLAVKARTAADEAAKYAGEAEAANKMAQAATTSEEANKHRMTAAEKLGLANKAKGDADDDLAEAKLVDIDNKTRAEAAALKAAQDAAKTASDEAKTHYMAAMTKAGDARDRATAARMAADKAMRARTDYKNADKYAKAAEEAAKAAETAEAAAMQAKEDASTAYMNAMGAGMSTEAEGHRDTAIAEQGKAKDAAGTADTEYMAAKGASGEAIKAAGIHVLELFMRANAYDVPQDSGTTVDDRKAETKMVGMAMATTAGAADGNQAGDNFIGSATWRADVMDDPTTEGTDESAGNGLMVSITVPGTTGSAIAVNTEGANANAKPMAKLDDDFKYGFDIMVSGDGGANTQVIAFTNKKPGKAAVTKVTEVTAKDATEVPVEGGMISKLGTKSGNEYTGVEFVPSGEDETAPYMGSLTCPSPAPTSGCTAETTADGFTVAGYVFTGSRMAREAVTSADAVENNNYLMLGLWLNEMADGTDTFGAFASGGTGYATTVAAGVTGTATYSGPAFGAHHKTGDGVNWFDGEAMLMADFGTATVAGTISGSISNISINGDDPISGSIRLGAAPLSDATFNGETSMGAQDGQGDYAYNGTWSGSFFGQSAAVDADNDNNIDAVAGTFGVTGTMGTGDDAITESFVGAFGAHK